jgi:5-methyltetrahydrofolate--homocysteine methyltransferase
MVRQQLQVRTVLGVSNISHGLPERDILNSVFLAAALSHGLDTVIADPGNTRLQETIAAWKVLSGNDRGARKYIEKWAGEKHHISSAAGPSEASAGSLLRQAILDGDRSGAVYSAQLTIDEGKKPLETVNRILIPALEAVGELYEQGTFFLPQLLLAAEAAEGAFHILKKYMQSGEGIHAGTVILATVKGDIHDIGKNIVSILLENHGYRIVDLGKDVAKETIAEAALKEKADIIGLSALMTTTMLEMEKTIAYLKAKQIQSAIMIGGAVITEEFAESAGANAFAMDAQDAIRKASILMKKRHDDAY